MSETQAAGPALHALTQELDSTMAVDRPALRARLRRLSDRAGRGQAVDRGLAELRAAVQSSAERAARRRAGLPRPEFPEELPVSAMRDAIGAAIDANQVVIVCGDTGSGKTTQLPKICLERGRGATGLIGHAQPRRIAARSVAARIAEELHTEVGGTVGYKVRFTDRASPDSLIKLMTDGILLAELQGDRELRQYDTLIIDEAHERSLNIDFLLGYLKRLLPRRPDLKLIITSATIDPESFSRFFDDAPVVRVPGRTYPVEVRYRPLAGEDDETQALDLTQGILDAVDELGRETRGDILVFLPGEREIRETAEALRKHHPPQTEILPLFSRLSVAEQNRIFQPHGARRIVLATNVAETSLTVPGIRCVVDSGLARISRYAQRSKVQRLPIEKISQASAEQRKGRCGRLGPGVCIRLYDEEDFAARPVFTDPEIRRTNLAEVILQMRALALGEVEDFPFLDAPDRRYINDGYRLLQELGAVDTGRNLTELGLRLARLPIDPRIARMLVAAVDMNALAEVAVISAALSVQDPRERPAEARPQADAAHAAFDDERSDFLAYCKLWQAWQEQKAHLSRNKLRQWCRKNFLSYLRMLEWEGVHKQLLTLVRQGGARLNQQPAEYHEVHRALLTGLLSNVAVKTEKDRYAGARNTQLYLFPGSSLARKGPKWIMAAEIVETSRVFARVVAGIEPAWIEELGAPLLKRTWFEPHWEKKAGRVVAYEQSTLYGLIVNPRRAINYARIDPAAARGIFLRDGLVPGELRTRGEFLAHNLALLEELEALEHKSRRRDILVDEERIFAFYDQLVPPEVNDVPGFEAWRRRAEGSQPRLLYMSRAFLLQTGTGEVDSVDFPDLLRVGGVQLPLSYHFEPGHAADGVTATVPVAALNQLAPERFEWLVPGLLEEKAAALIRGLPKALRRNFVPAPDFARAVVRRVDPGQEQDLLHSMSGELKRMTGIEVPPADWQPEKLPVHLRMNFRVVDAAGKPLAEGRDLAVLQGELGGRAEAAFPGRKGHALERETVGDWDFGPLPETVQFEQAGVSLQGFPALVEEDGRVALRVLDNPERAARATRGGLRRLFMGQLGDKVRYLRKNLPGLQTMCLQFAPVGSCEALKDDLLRAVFDRVFLHGEMPRDAEAFAARLEAGRERLVPEATRVAGLAAAALKEYHAVAKRLRGRVAPQSLPVIAELRDQLERLIHPGFIAATPEEWFGHLPRFVRAIGVRLDKLEQNPQRDAAASRTVNPLWEAFWGAVPADQPLSPDWEEFRWLLEELRVSLFAQELRTSQPVSVKRLQQRWRELAG